MEQGFKVNACNLLMVDSVPDQLFKEVIPKIKTPLLLMLAGQENIICNAKAKEFYDAVPV